MSQPAPYMIKYDEEEGTWHLYLFNRNSYQFLAAYCTQAEAEKAWKLVSRWHAQYFVK